MLILRDFKMTPDNVLAALSFFLFFFFFFFFFFFCNTSLKKYQYGLIYFLPMFLFILALSTSNCYKLSSALSSKNYQSLKKNKQTEIRSGYS